MTAAVRAWQAGDRVLIGPSGAGTPRHPNRWIAGTVRQVDVCKRPGLVVDLDERVNGVRDCYATHSKLRSGPRRASASPCGRAGQCNASSSGALSTGTHGTGARLPGLGAMVAGPELVLADGSCFSCSAAERPEVFAAARVGLGALGVLSTVTLQTVREFMLRAVEGPDRLDAGARLLRRAGGAARPHGVLLVPAHRPRDSHRPA